MNVYSIHVRELNSNQTPAPKLVLVKDGFSLTATAFGPLWALVIGMWESAIIIFIIQIMFGFIINALVPGVEAGMAAQVGVAITIGIVANELRRWNLSRRGFDEKSSVLGLDAADAERRYLEANPDVLAQLEGAA